MRASLIALWLLLPILVGAYHFGPGQQRLQLDAAAATLNQANQAVNEQRWSEAFQHYSAALAQLPKNRADQAFRIRLEMAKAQMMAQQLPEARLALDELLLDLETRTTPSQELVREARATLANAQYHMTWLLRLEGKPSAEWEPEVEAARQHYRLLAETSQAERDTQSTERYQHDLEATIRLARMDLKELQGLPIPSQCQGCCSGQCKKPGKKRSQKPNPKKGAWAALGPLPDGSGS
jgi:hypothetical protein